MARAEQGSPPAAEQAQQQDQAPAAAAAAPGNALERVPGRRDVLAPLDVQATKQAMGVYQEGLQALLSDGDWQGKPGADGSFVKKSGWRKIAAWFSLDLEIVSEEVTYAQSDDEHERAKKGDPLRAKVIARATAPNGRRADGDGRCSINESRFAQAKGRQKLDNDLPGTATTRACNRAISNLVGLGAVSGEEVGEDAPAAAGPPFGPATDEENVPKIKQALAYLADTGDGPDEQTAEQVYAKLVEDAGGYMPRQIGRAMQWLAAAVKVKIDGEEAQTGVPAESAEQAAEAQAGEQAQAAAERDPDPEPEVVDGEIVPEGEPNG